PDRSAIRQASRSPARRFPPRSRDVPTIRKIAPGSGECFFRRRRLAVWPSGLRTHRELHDEAAAVPVVALDEDAAAMRLDDVLDDREPESGRAGRVTVGAILREALEDVVANLGRDPRPAIGDLQLREIISRWSCGYLDRPALGRIAQCVADK